MPKTYEVCWSGAVPSWTRKLPVCAGWQALKSPTPAVTVPEKTGVPAGSVTIENGVPSAASGAVKRLLSAVL